jgi:CBS domain-containing protein
MRPRELHATRVGSPEAAGDGVSAARTVADVMTDDLRPIVSEMPLHQASRLLLEQKAQKFRQAVGTTVTDLMTHPVVTASPTLPLGTAVSLFDPPSIRVVPVVADGCLVGTVTRADVLRALAPEASTPEWRSDGDLVNEMRARMLEEQAWVPIPRPAVSACDGLVVLWGLVDSSAQKAALDTMARAIPGCRGVENHLVTAERRDHAPPPARAHARTAASRRGPR